jgi:hypothetical protein
VEAIDWQAIGEKLSAPFAPEAVEWRVQGKPAPNKRCQIVAYVDARVVAERLDDAVGCGNWSFTYTPLVVADGALRVAQGRLSIFGTPKEDIGEAGAIEPNKATVSSTLKRCAVLWGVGRYLYSLPAVWVTLDGEGKISEQMLATLRQRLAARAAA